jgi:hypothetical protein
VLASVSGVYVSRHVHVHVNLPSRRDAHNHRSRGDTRVEGADLRVSSSTTSFEIVRETFSSSSVLGLSPIISV